MTADASFKSKILHHRVTTTPATDKRDDQSSSRHTVQVKLVFSFFYSMKTFQKPMEPAYKQQKEEKLQQRSYVLDTGPDPFPYRRNKPNMQENSLLHYYKQIDDREDFDEIEEPGFELADFSYAGKIEPVRTFGGTKQLGAIRAFTRTLCKDDLTFVDINELVTLDPVPTRIPLHQFKLQQQALEKQANKNEALQEKILKSYEQQIPPCIKRPVSELEDYITLEPREETRDYLNSRNISREMLHGTPIDAMIKCTPPSQVTQFQAMSRENTPVTVVHHQSALQHVVEESFQDNGGYTLSLRGWFLNHLIRLNPLERSLVYLNLSFNSFEEFPPALWHCKMLKVLKLRDNPITEIPPEIRELSRLKIVMLSFCKIEKISKEFCELPALVYCDLSYNYLSEVRPEFGQLKTLKYLNLSGNQLRGFPKQMMKLNLERVKFKNNFMRVAFWKDFKLVKRDDEIKEENHNSEDEEFSCDICGSSAGSNSYTVLRPCSEIWGKTKVPFLMKCCGWDCAQTANAVQSATELS